MTLQTEFLAHALSLPSADRAEIARRLILSLETEPRETDLAVIDEAWKIEIERRLGEIDRGEVTLLDWREVVERLQKNLDRRGPA